MADGPVPGGGELEPWPPYQAAPRYAVRQRRPRIDFYLRLTVGAGLALLGWSFATGSMPGQTTTSYSEYVEIPVVEPAGAPGAMPLESAEEFVSTYKASRDAKGSYVESGQDIARAFGAELVWSDWDNPERTSPCRHDPHDSTEALAWFCTAEPFLIHLNRTATTMPRALYFPDFMDTVRHELAHLDIEQRCEAWRPARGTVELEAVTSSYAVLYLGADRKALGAATSGYAEYEMTKETDSAATWIHAGVCR